MKTLQRCTLAMCCAVILTVWPVLSSRSLAQEATPSPGLEGIDIENLGVALPTGEADKLLEMTRITFQPGAMLPAHSQPGTIILFVDTGVVALTVTDGDVRGGVQIFRQQAGMPSRGTPTPEEVAELDTEVVLNAGDAVVLDQDVVRSYHNAGDGEAAVLISSLLALDEPSFQFTEDGTATPAA